MIASTAIMINHTPPPIPAPGKSRTADSGHKADAHAPCTTDGGHKADAHAPCARTANARATHSERTDTKNVVKHKES